MTLDRIAQIRALANQHKGHKSAQIIHECLDSIEETQRLYCLCVDAAFSGGQRLKAGYALAQLKNLVYQQKAT